MKIIEVPNPKLRQVSKPIEELTPQLLKFIEDLETALRNKTDPEGVGLSAPQVGQNIRLFSTYLGDDNSRTIRTYINPQITRTSERMTLGPNPKKPFLEGCLSIPLIYAPVERHHWIKLKFSQIDPKNGQLFTRTKRFESFPARVIQHELDHLDGILFTDHTTKQGLPIYKEGGEKLIEISPEELEY